MKPEIIFFDCDGILTFDFLWDKFHINLGLDPEAGEKMFNDYYSGKLGYSQWIHKLENFYNDKSLTEKYFQKSFQNFTLNPEAEKLLKYLNQKKYKTAVISSGIDIYVEKIARRLDIPDWYANNTFEFDEKGFFKKLSYGIPDEQAKVMHIKSVCKKYSVSPDQTIFIGDSFNDLEAFRFTGHGILYKPDGKPYRNIAWKTVENLEEIKKLI